MDVVHDVLLHTSCIKLDVNHRTTSFSEAYLIFVSIRFSSKIFHQKNTNLVKFDMKEAVFSNFLNEI